MTLHTEKFKIRLGFFIAIGLLLFVAAIFVIGRQKNMFNPVFTLTTHFNNISGLQVGNNVRFAGINVGTIENIAILNDSTVGITMIIRKEIHQFIKTDSRVRISSEGIIGDKFIVISQGTSMQLAKNNQILASTEPLETDEIMASLYVTVENAEFITSQLSEILFNINNGNGTLGRLIQDTMIAENINKTIINLRKSSKGLNENMEAAKHNVFLRSYFKKK